MQEILRVQELQTHFFMPGYVVRAIDSLSFSLREGEILGIVGESGSGKSQMAMSIMGLVPKPGKIVSGSIYYKNIELTAQSEEEYRNIRGNRISMIFQEPMTSLNPIFTIAEQISESLEIHRNVSKTEAHEIAGELLQLVGISDPQRRLHEYPFQLSGGLRQRVMIAMAMSCHPDILIADEPTTALDVTIQAQILRVLEDLSHRNNTATLFITHDLAVIARFTQRVLVMYAGHAMEDASVREVFRKPLHPYTQALLQSIPHRGSGYKNADGTRKKLQSIEGSSAEVYEETMACKFASRCPRVMKKCLQAKPALVEVEQGHKVRCFLYSDEVQAQPKTQE